MDSWDEMDQDYEETKPRLNMKHGFIHHIRRNQIDRLEIIFTTFLILLSTCTIRVEHTVTLPLKI